MKLWKNNIKLKIWKKTYIFGIVRSFFVYCKIWVFGRRVLEMGKLYREAVEIEPHTSQ